MVEKWSKSYVHTGEVDPGRGDFSTLSVKVSVVSENEKAAQDTVLRGFLYLVGSVRSRRRQRPFPRHIPSDRNLRPRAGQSLPEWL